MFNLTQVIDELTITKACNIKADKDSIETKRINVAVRFIQVIFRPPKWNGSATGRGHQLMFIR